MGKESGRRKTGREREREREGKRDRGEEELPLSVV